MNVNQNKLALLIAINHSLYSLEVKKENKQTVFSHNACITDLLYNEKLGQLISVCEGSCITIWYLSTGQKVKTITNAHGKCEITALALDLTGTRILTAGTDGLIKIWDMNGTCHNVLVADRHNPCEITQVLYLNRVIIALGWSKVICSFRVSDLKSYFVSPQLEQWKGNEKHNDDILSAEFIQPRTLITASYDGDIIIWNTNTQNALRKIMTNTDSTQLILPPVDRQQTDLVSQNFCLLKSHSLNPDIPADESSSTTRNVVSITSIGVFKTRNSIDPKIGDIFTTHSDGTLKVWNSRTRRNLCKFKVFESTGSVVSSVDSRDLIMGFGGETGQIKLFEIKDLANGTNDSHPNLMFKLLSHTDSITRIKIIETLDLLYILSSSRDCTIALHCYDNLIGVFGQEAHWNLNDEAIKLRNKNEDDLSLNVVPKSEELNGGDLQLSDEDALVKEITIKFSDDKRENDIMADNEVLYNDDCFDMKNSWDNTILGQTYKEDRKSKRNRKQPFEIEAKWPMSKSSYNNLEIVELKSDPVALEKPDFIQNPEKYFMKTNHEKNKMIHHEEEFPKLINEYNEEKLFPKSVLDHSVKLSVAKNLVGVKPGKRISFKNPITSSTNLVPRPK